MRTPHWNGNGEAKRPKSMREELRVLRQLCETQSKMLKSAMAVNIQLRAQLLAATIDSKDKLFLVEEVSREVMARFGFDMSKIDQSYLDGVKPAEPKPTAPPEKRFRKEYGK